MGRIRFDNAHRFWQHKVAQHKGLRDPNCEACDEFKGNAEAEARVAEQRAVRIRRMRHRGFTPGQAGVLLDLLDGPRTFNGRQFKAVKFLKKLGYVKADFDLNLHAHGSATWTISVTITDAGREAAR